MPQSPDAQELEVALNVLRRAVVDPSRGLPQEVFLWLSSVTAMVNVDLLIRDPNLGVLLTWRDDGYYGPGWHVPGGILRFKESAIARVQAVALRELGTSVKPYPEPLCLHEVTHRERKLRGHFVSMLFDCQLDAPAAAALKFDPKAPVDGAWAWHASCPTDLIAVHAMYRPWLRTSHRNAWDIDSAEPVDAPPWAQARRLLVARSRRTDVLESR